MQFERTTGWPCDVGSFTHVAVGRIHSRLEPGRRFLYLAAERSFGAELAVDEDGLLTDCPSLFARMLQ